jgi:hypothetical protein
MAGPDTRAESATGSLFPAAWEAARRVYNENRSKFPVQDLLPFLGKTVAWAPDGSRIVDADESFGALCDKLKARGEDPSLFVFEDIPIL